VKKVTFRKVFPNPANIKQKTGITKNIISAGWKGGDLVVTFDEEPTQGELQAVLNLLKTGQLWEIIEEEG